MKTSHPVLLVTTKKNKIGEHARFGRYLEGARLLSDRLGHMSNAITSGQLSFFVMFINDVSVGCCNGGCLGVGSADVSYGPNGPNRQQYHESRPAWPKLGPRRFTGRRNERSWKPAWSQSTVGRDRSRLSAAAPAKDAQDHPPSCLPDVEIESSTRRSPRTPSFYRYFPFIAVSVADSFDVWPAPF